MSRNTIRWVLGFLMRTRNDRVAAVLAAVALALLGLACGSGASPCQHTGCAAPPLCSTGCQAQCGCCTCTPGTRSGDLICTNGCYDPAPASDGGSDVDGGGAIVCQLPFEVGPCDALFPVYQAAYRQMFPVWRELDRARREGELHD